MNIEKTKLALFEEKEIRKKWKDNDWYFSVIDVVYVLTDGTNPNDYWYRIKKKHLMKKNPKENCWNKR